MASQETDLQCRVLFETRCADTADLTSVGRMSTNDVEEGPQLGCLARALLDKAC